MVSVLQSLQGGHFSNNRCALAYAMTKLSLLVKCCASLVAVMALSGCFNTMLGRLEVVNARPNQDGEGLELLVARESRYKIEPSADEVWTTLHYALHVVNLPAADLQADWNSLENQSRKILSFNGPPPKDVDYYYAAGTLFTTHYAGGSEPFTLQATALRWCAVQSDDVCKPVGEVPLASGDRRVAHDRDGGHFFAAHQLFATDRAQPLLNVAGRPGYQQFVGGQLDRPMLVAHRWLLAASHRTQQPGAPILHIYDLEHDTVETVLAQALPQRGLPEVLAVDKDEQGWQLLIQQTDCREVGKNTAGGKDVKCDKHYGIQRPGQSQPEPVHIPPEARARINWRVDFGHWDSRRKRLWLFEAINRYDKPRGIEVMAVQY